MKAIKITHLYPKHMSLYGDRGNIVSLLFRAKKLGLEVALQDCSLGEVIDKDTKFIMLGGGQDHDQLKVVEDLLKRRNEIADLVSGGAIILGVCGGYQLLGEFYEDAAGNSLKGLELLNFYTKRAKNGEKRIIGNVIAKSNLFGLLVGFENHGGRTFLPPSLNPLAQIVQGGGNNAKDKTEGVFQKFEKGLIIGTYFHSFLPKNPKVIDFILEELSDISSSSKAFDNVLENINHKIIINLPH
jgi:lipid II isoglutaminyl synthase (glutamine-hydrolysing)